MADEKPVQEKEVTPKGAVEVDEKDLEQAEGGISGYSAPTIDDFNKKITTVQKVAPPTLIVPDGTKTLT